MGTYTFYLTSRGNASECKINWSTVDVDIISKCSRLAIAYEKRCNSLQEVAELLNESKLFGYLTYELRCALLELNSNLVPTSQEQEQPTVFYTWEGDNSVIALEFYPGTDKLLILSYDQGEYEDNKDVLLSIADLDRKLWKVFYV